MDRTASLPLGRIPSLCEEAHEVSSFLNDIEADIGETRRHLNMLTTLEDVATQRSQQLFARLQSGSTANDAGSHSRSHSR